MAFPFAVVAGLFGSVVDLFKGDKEKQAQLAEKQIDAMQASEQRGADRDIAQLKVNEAEANNPSFFVAGWRPAFGWVGAVACFIDWIVRPTISIFGIDIPPLSTELMWTIITGLLGVSGYRTYEKVKGTSIK